MRAILSDSPCDPCLQEYFRRCKGANDDRELCLRVFKARERELDKSQSRPCAAARMRLASPSHSTLMASK